MKFFRLHKIRYYTVLTIVFGFTLYMWKPVAVKEQQNEFANWLETLKKDKTSESLNSKLSDLSKKNADLNEIIEQASVIIQEHNDDFELPVDANTAADLQQFLYNSWHLNQQNDGMSTPVRYELVKTYSTLSNDFLQLNAGASSIPTLQHSLKAIVIDAEISEFDSISLSPLKSGIAIGAP